MKDQIKLKIEETILCPKCSSTHLNKDSSRAEIVCNNCGLVIEENLIDYSPEWRAFDKEQREKRAHTGSPINYMIHDKGLSTTIGWINKDSYGRSIPMRNRAQLYRLRKWQKRTRISNTIEKNIAQALSTLDRISSTMFLPRNVRETAAMIYRKAALRNLVRGRSIEGVAAAALYAACRQCHTPRTLEEISKISIIPKREIGRNYRFISRELKIKLMPTSPQDYISRFSNMLKLSGEVLIKAKQILKDAEDGGITNGQNPIGTAAAVLYIASILCDDRRTQKDIADKAGVTEVTIRNRYKELSEKLGIEIPL